jgi:hypothetical protein
LVKQRQTFRIEKEFGLIVGAVFLLLGAWWWYRGKFVTAREIAIAVGALLILLGLIAPRLLVYPNRIWTLLAELLGFVSTRIILAFVFFFVITPIGVTKRLLGWDPLGRRGESLPSYWRPYAARQRDHRHYEKMY